MRKGDQPLTGYKLLKFLGRGGFGEVWKAQGPGGVELALKFINLHSKHGWRELRSLRHIKQIRHANLLPIMGLWTLDDEGQLLEDEGTPQTSLAEVILAMPVADKNLSDYLNEVQEQGYSGLPWQEILRLLDDAAAAIDFLNSPRHDLGNGLVAIQHCDIKPHNMLLTGDSVQVCDFGLARILEDGRASTHSHAEGTLAYMAPESLVQLKPSPSTDQYSLAITYVELRTGRVPFSDTSIQAVIDAHLRGKLELGALPPAERRIIERATAREPTDRYSSAQQMMSALRDALTHDTAPLTDTLVLSAGLHVPKAPPEFTVSPFTDEEAQTHQRRWADWLELKPTLEILDLKLVLIPPGEFWMGSPEAELQRQVSGETRHKVKISHPFYLSAYPITQADFQRLTQSNPSSFSVNGNEADQVAGHDTHNWPVEWVSWEEAVLFCNKLTELAAHQHPLGSFRLPTEAEWEYACRAGTTTPNHFGYEFSSEQANFDGRYPYLLETPGHFIGHPCAVGGYPANAFGLYDMHGNVWEWCHDWYSHLKEESQLPLLVDPAGPQQGVYRVLRGGSWSCAGHYCRSARRNRLIPIGRNSDIGIRVAWLPKSVE